ncbi:uncharacterized protein LOC132751821 isoform X2 [Ruditapes philippinarum]|uniref:uncharacterized protein LOC132751821 isoform X2 n=1 Tax=Ruditapes philippinarum TaxID=129788 RepID=UPI00295C2B23|nr:uncharacterized protein LOC132751821 isoform X2 [Ruditapes philippinarum]
MADETFLVKLTIDNEEVTVSVTADIVEALNSNDTMVRHHAYELVAKAVGKEAEKTSNESHDDMPPTELLNADTRDHK